MHIIIKESGAGTAPSNGFICVKNEKITIFHAQFTLFLVEIRRKFKCFFSLKFAINEHIKMIKIKIFIYLQEGP